MSYSSFSSITGNQPSAIQPNGPMAMKEGQVVHGTIKQLFPNQTAEVQIGGQKVIAKLEAPLKAGDAHFFQVTKGAPELQLKVVTGPLEQGKGITQQAQQLIQAMGLNKSMELQAAAQFFLKEQLPISKEILLQAEHLLKNPPQGASLKAGLEAIQKMMELKLPLTEQMLQTLVSGKSTKGMLPLIQQLNNAIQQDNSIPAVMKHTLQDSLLRLQEPFRFPQAGALLGNQLSAMLDEQTPVADRLQILQALKEAGVLPSNATLNSVVPGEGAAIKGTAGEVLQTKNVEFVRSWVENQSLLTSSQKETLLASLKGDSNNIQQQLIKAFSALSQQAIFEKDAAGFTPKEHLLSLLGKGETREAMQQSLTQIAQLGRTQAFSAGNQAAEQLIVQQLDGKAMEHAMKEVLRSLGFSYEGKLSGPGDDVRQLSAQLKPQLVELLQQPQISSAIRETAEGLLHRMNGLQLLSAENGAQHQLLMQLPLELMGKKMDATLEWNGRMKEDGKIDSDYARILFYLQLESLQETVVDMQVQNRVVTITLFNELPQLQAMVDPLKDQLKAGLASLDYKLSGVFVKGFQEQQLSSKWKQKSVGLENQGVDIRI